MHTKTLESRADAAADQTVDEREVRFYTSLAETWWDQSGPFWPLHRLNALRVEYLRNRLADQASSTDPKAPLSGLDIVDIGCGGGILSESMAKSGASVTGIDVVERNIAIARLHGQSQGLDSDYRLATAADLRRNREHFDVVLNMEVVEHVADVDQFLSDCCALLRPGGIMAVATINRTLLSYLFAIIGAEYVLGWLPRGTHRWSQFISPREVESRLSAFGMRKTEQVGVRVNPINRSFALSKITAVNYMMLFKKIT